MQFPDQTPPPETDHAADKDRRKFLASCGKFAIVTPPAVTLLLSTSLNSTAIAHSSGQRGGRDHGRDRDDDDDDRGRGRGRWRYDWWEDRHH